MSTWAIALECFIISLIGAVFGGLMVYRLYTRKPLHKPIYYIDKENEESFYRRYPEVTSHFEVVVREGPIGPAE